mmetsp:Transcript_8248/g.36482  ORF Transcript_8248/g.36482 Transcript_8248/m.36482 type:complete len:224 (-) Transcript_8248:492-1163(-)
MRRRKLVWQQRSVRHQLSLQVHRRFHGRSLRGIAAPGRLRHPRWTPVPQRRQVQKQHQHAVQLPAQRRRTELREGRRARLPRRDLLRERRRLQMSFWQRLHMRVRRGIHRRHLRRGGSRVVPGEVQLRRVLQQQEGGRQRRGRGGRAPGAHHRGGRRLHGVHGAQRAQGSAALLQGRRSPGRGDERAERPSRARGRQGVKASRRPNVSLGVSVDVVFGLRSYP